MTTEKKPAPPNFVPQQGQRAFIVGQTGSGKTQFAVWLLERLSNSPVVIYDTKGEPKFDDMPRCRVVHSETALRSAVADPQTDYVVFRVPPETLADTDAMDDLLWAHFHELRGCDIYIDEVFNFSNNGRAKKGLIAMLAQGRSHGFTCIMAAQKPVWLSSFIISESQHYFIFYLQDKRDKVRMGEAVPNFEDCDDPPEHHFYYWAPRMPEPVLMSPVKLDKGSEKPYKPAVAASGAQDVGPDEESKPDQGTALSWL